MKSFIIKTLLRGLIAALDAGLGRDGWNEKDVADEIRDLRSNPPKEAEIPDREAAMKAFEEGRAADED